MTRRKRGEVEPPEFVLYVMGTAPNSRKAVENLKKAFAQIRHYELEVVDIQEAPERAKQDQVIAVPTLIKIYPEPQKRVLGDLSDGAKVRAATGLNDEVE